MNEHKTATEIRRLDGWRGDARLYRLDPPMVEDRSRQGEDSRTHHHVIVSAVVAYYTGPETYIFPAMSDGSPVDFGELDGSMRGTLDHAEALRNAGYEAI